MELLFFRDPKTKGCGKKRVAERFGLRNAGLDQWFPTVVLWDGAKGAAVCWIYENSKLNLWWIAD